MSAYKVTVSPGPVVEVICNVSVGLLSSKVKGTWFFLVGSLCTAVAKVLYAAMDETASYWKFEAWGQALCVVGPDLVASMGYIYITSVVNLPEVAVAGASLQFVVAFAYTCGPAFSTVTYTNLMRTNHRGFLPRKETKNDDHFLASLRAAFWLWAALCFAAAILTVLFLRNMKNVLGKGEKQNGTGQSPHPNDMSEQSQGDDLGIQHASIGGPSNNDNNKQRE
ncbi:hypothetical protein QFC21_003874 [Naganishia friedmannii]|uniref:Uncharacterized protein n=1 Tax=Naganishia friedmannii TaxID=89922 RepID=A0ACC2VLJ1_9TREE|nr:hypothetical protein QFC21_003874 [Naganishia friedmannii]